MVTTKKSEKHQCRSCGKPAERCCVACLEAPSITGGLSPTTWYCGAACHRADWVAHKKGCKASKIRKTLFRAGSTAQLVFYMYREINIDWAYTTVEETNGLLNHHLGLDLCLDELVFPFSSDTALDEHSRQSLLSDYSCGDTCGFMHNLIKTLLQGTNAIVEELQILPKNMLREPRKPTLGNIHQMIDDSTDTHTILLVTLNNGEIYVLDLTGAQYGHYDETVLPWQAYKSHRVLTISRRVPFGYSKINRELEALMISGWKGKRMGIYQSSLQQLYAASSTWQRENLSLQDMLELSDMAFSSKQREFVQYLKAHLQTHKASLQAEAFSYLLVGPSVLPGREMRFYCPSPRPSFIYEYMDILATLHLFKDSEIER